MISEVGVVEEQQHCRCSTAGKSIKAPGEADSFACAIYALLPLWIMNA